MDCPGEVRHMTRQRVSSGTEWEEHVGYSRAVRAGDQVHVSGTTPVDDEGAVVGEGPYEQTVAALEIVEGALAEAGASLSDVVRTRLYVTDIDDYEAVGRAHGEAFADVRPASSMVEVARLVREEFRVEVEATAVVAE
jgi:enamine deaminase RidA (YjgF/YER057c/UK114 family)